MSLTRIIPTCSVKTWLSLVFIVAAVQLLWLFCTLQQKEKTGIAGSFLSRSYEVKIPNTINHSLVPNHFHTGLKTPTRPCQFITGTNSKSKLKKVVVIGASSFVGANIARTFSLLSVPVVPSEDSVNIRFDPLAWYRWEKLIAMKLSPQYVNFSDYSMTRSFIKKHQPSTIVYVPTILLETAIETDVRIVTEAYENFIVLLEIVRTISPSTNIIFTSISEPQANKFAPIMKLFESSLSVYNYVYSMNVLVIRTEGLYGIWKVNNEPSEALSKIFISDFVKDLESALRYSVDYMICTYIKHNGTKFSDGFAQTKSWLEEYRIYLSQQTKDIIASPYFTTKRNAQYPIEFINNNYYFMENWFKNIYKMNLHMVVYHDDLSDKFVSTFEKNYPKADFDRITNFYDFRPNDRRYLAYYEYIIAHPEIRRIVMTDMRDLIIQNNPFEIMDIIGDVPYIGLDRPFFETLEFSSAMMVFRRCFNKGNLDYPKMIKMLHFYNAGSLAGSRHVTLAILTRFLMYFQITNKDNCNMALIEYIYHKYYFDQLVTGWPFNTAFITDQPNIPGLAVLHKWDLISNN